MNLTDDAQALADAQPVIDVAEVIAETREPTADPATPNVPALIPADDDSRDLIPAHGELTVLAQLAVTFAQAGLVPKPLQGKPADVLLVLMTGRGLGIDPMVALRECHPIDGRVTVSPKLKLAIVRQRRLGRVWPDEGNDDTQAIWHAVRADDPTETVYTGRYTIEDARRANLTGKDNWKKYPAQMLTWRCLPDRAEALTRSGWIHHSKLSEGDDILGFDKATGTNQWTKVTRINVFEAAQTYRIESTTFAMTATADHRWIVDHFVRGPGEWRDRVTSDLDSGQYRLITAAPLQDAESLISPDDAARIGWTLTDGSIRWRGTSPTITVMQSKYVEEVRALFTDALETVSPAKVSTIRGIAYDSKPIIRWRMSAGASRRLLAQFGFDRKTDHLDHIPAMLDSAGRTAMWDAMNLANGTRRKGGGWQFRTGHESVLSCWMTLAALLGHRTGRPTFAKGCWSVSALTRPLVASKRLSIVPAAVEQVWCPTTDLGTWVTRLDGQVTITGNSLGYLIDMAFGEVGTGLYGADELGAVTDDEGRAVIDVTEVSPLAGIEPKPAPPPSTANEIASEDERDGIKARIDTLPPPAVTVLRELWAKEDRDGNPTLWPLKSLPNRQVKAAHALIDAVVKRAAGGEWGQWSPPSTDEAPSEPESAPTSDAAVEDPSAPAATQDAADDDPECTHDGCSEPVAMFADDGLPWCADHAPL